ncbi:hypothetical protein [Oceanimonas sp. MB9]|uniref:hypothetical protein n=1 Tax=Oceanimonas sp. MB9 TaxID=2588453 RepID=UPI001980AF94|nr:hypothetical protein [Oceanimonas sp. MB9]NHI02123.1 hypothetical protein [Oceanimonas sp. MB9]
MKALTSVSLNSLFLAVVALAPQHARADAYSDYMASPSAAGAFQYLYQVATHPRCANCHGVVEDGIHRPTVGDQRIPHPMNITSLNNIRLIAQDGKFVMADNLQPVNCRSCHRDENGTEAGMPPGAANDLMPGFVWHMPPVTMVIEQDITPAELCNNWLDPAKNSFLAMRGGRSDMATFKKEFEHHVQDDPLVRWSWDPGLNRTPAPGSHKDFAQAMTLWIDGGAPCPAG